MKAINRWTGLGKLTRDPEVTTLDSGKTVANFTIAVTEFHKDKSTGEKKEKTEFINLVAWEYLAELSRKYLKKGDQVLVEGRLYTRHWEQDGNARYITGVNLDSLTMLSVKVLTSELRLRPLTGKRFESEQDQPKQTNYSN